MPRQARIDAPGAVHHVIVRGIERRRIFEDDADRRDFLERLGRVLVETKTPCYAWALIPNHFHLLLETGRKPVGRAMQSLLTGHALAFNRRHRRAGHLFQNRYKSILCERDSYLLELVRYIHLNPLRAGLVRGLSELDRHPWTGHSVLMGNREARWQAVDEVLLLFGRRAGEARGRYRKFVSEGIPHGYRADLVGGGLVRSLGGWEAVAEARRRRERQACNERILGSGDFVVETLKVAEEAETRRSRLRRDGVTWRDALRRAAAAAKIPTEDLRGGGKRPAQCLGRSLACKWMVQDLGLRGSEAAQHLAITPAAVSRNVHRGADLERSLRVRLDAAIARI